MNPDTGRIYPDLATARLDSVAHPVEVIGRPEDVQRISDAVADAHRRELTAAERTAKKVRNKAAKRARRQQR